jgi:hypothetical protein
MRFNKKEALIIKEQKELEILESLSDIFDSSTRSGDNTREKFMG